MKTQKLRELAQAANQNGDHIYTHHRDSNNWEANRLWNAAASPANILPLIDSHDALLRALKNAANKLNNCRYSEIPAAERAMAAITAAEALV